METIFSILLNPHSSAILGVIIALGFIASPYEIQFEDGDEIEI